MTKIISEITPEISCTEIMFDNQSLWWFEIAYVISKAVVPLDST